MAYIALGSNLGDREQTLRLAIAQLAALPGTHLAAVSKLRQTAPVDAPKGSGPFLNAAAAIETDLPPARLMQALLQIEQNLGRNRTAELPNGPRTIDLDLLLHGDTVMNSAALTLPHPRMSARRFVLEPLAEIAAEVRHPVTGITAAQMLQALAQETKC